MSPFSHQKLRPEYWDSSERSREAALKLGILQRNVLDEEVWDPTGRRSAVQSLGANVKWRQRTSI